MRRRQILAGLGAMLVARSAEAARAVVGPPFQGGTPLRAWVENPEIVRQECPLWCWAASASMIFAAHGRPVDQRRIVERVFGADVCRSVPDTATIGRVLSEPWQDDRGQAFRPNVVAAYDA